MPSSYGPFKDAFWWMSYESSDPTSSTKPRSTPPSPRPGRVAAAAWATTCSVLFATRRLVRLRCASRVMRGSSPTPRCLRYPAGASGRWWTCARAFLTAAVCDSARIVCRDVLGEEIRAGRKVAHLYSMSFFRPLSDAYCAASPGSQLDHQPTSWSGVCGVNAPTTCFICFTHPASISTTCPMQRRRTHRRGARPWFGGLAMPERLRISHRAEQLGGFFSKHALALDSSTYALDEIFDWVERTVCATRRSLPCGSNAPSSRGTQRFISTFDTTWRRHWRGPVPGCGRRD